jgi:ATP-dependent Clp protease ATP-binding subunit ClpA
MLELIWSNEDQLTRLKSRATGKCLRLNQCRMPPGAEPARAMVGIEVAPSATRLYVQRGIRYQGDTRDIQEWLQAGARQFPSFDAMMHWLRTTLSPAYRGQRVDRTWLLERLQQEVRGQDDVLCYLAETVARHSARTAPRQPATFFALGPSGVGKTRTAETLAAALQSHDPEAGYLRLDMTEYQERHRLSQFFGAPPGYIGYGDSTPLIDTLVDHPRSVVLFDEIEKAHPDVLLSLMNALDAGRLTAPVPTSKGRTIDCRQAIFFFTSNLLAEDILQELEERQAFGRTSVVDAVCRESLVGAGLRRELVGRIHHFLVFRPLSLDARAEILALAIARVAKEYGLRIQRTAPGVILALLKQSRLEGFGARPDEYLIDRVLGDCFAAAARVRGPSPIEVQGPPFRCVLADPAVLA